MNYEKHKLWITERLAKEQAEREARELMWQLVTSELAHLENADISLEVNPLDLGIGGMSYLEQVHIVFPEEAANSIGLHRQTGGGSPTLAIGSK